MSVPESKGYVLNRSRSALLATRLAVADTHWSRFMGLMGRDPETFAHGDALWITPCRGVHTFAMRFPIDVAYLDREGVVVHMERSLRPWRVAPVRLKAASVLELPDNTLKATGTDVGDRVEISVGATCKEGER